MSVTKNLNFVLDQIENVRKESVNAAEKVHLIAVSKTKPIELIQEAYAAGQMDFGENKVQELVEKHELLPEARWHLIGHLQTNKVKYIIDFVHLIHSVDSEKLLKEINKRAAATNRSVNCLLQVKIATEETKFGLSEEKVVEILNKISEFTYVKILGLMGMASLTLDEEQVRNEFSRLAELKERFKSFENEQVEMKYLSMGMSADYEIAIAQGSNMIRVGSRIFGER